MFHKTTYCTDAPRQWMISNLAGGGDWRTTISAHPAHVGLLLRDYEASGRRSLAADMAALCRRQKRAFSIAGDARLATKYGARFHCPSYLIGRPAARCGRAGPDDSAAIHDETELIAAAKAGFGTVFISPVFATNTHPGAFTLGPLRALALLRKANDLGLKAYALGGMDAAHYRRLGGPEACHGWAAISAFG